MSNTVLLKSAIERSGYKLSYLASKIGITPYSLTKKINNVTEFKSGEIKELCSILNIKGDEIQEYFFADMVDE